MKQLLPNTQHAVSQCNINCLTPLFADTTVRMALMRMTVTTVTSQWSGECARNTIRMFFLNCESVVCYALTLYLNCETAMC